MPFLGMRGTGNWADGERPMSWRQGILYRYPNGMAPLTGLLSKMSEEKLDDYQFHWWTKQLSTQGGAITGVFTNVGLTNAYVSGGVAGDTLYIKMAQATADQFRPGHQALLRDSDHLDVDVNSKITAVVKNGANSYVAARLLEADDNGATTDLSDADAILINGDINPQGGPMPEAVSYNPVQWLNKTQIFREPLDITRTARLTKLRTEDAYREAKRESLQYHSIQMEKAFIWGIMTENIGDNGQPETTTMGLVNAIKQGAPENVVDFTLDTAFSGDTWLASGEEWLDATLERVFRFGASEKMSFVGSGALLGINRLAKSAGQIQLQPQTTSYGLKVMEWITPFGTLYLKTHPLFSFEATTRNCMIIFEPKDLKYRFMTDTTFYAMPQKDVSPSHERIDGTKEEWLTECGLEYHHPNGWGFLNGLGLNNVV